MLKRQQGTVLGFFPRTTWPAGDRAAEDEVRQRLQSALVVGLTPTERTVTLIALLQVTGLLAKVVTTEDRKALQGAGEGADRGRLGGQGRQGRDRRGGGGCGRGGRGGGRRRG